MSKGGVWFGAKMVPPCINIFTWFPRARVGTHVKKCFRYRTIRITKNKTGANGKNKKSGRKFIFAEQKKLN